MATQNVALGPFNNVSLAVGTQYHLTAGPGHAYFNIVNTGTSNVAISNANTVGLSDPASFLLLPNQSLSPLVWGPTGLWVAAGAAEVISVAVVPRSN